MATLDNHFFPNLTIFLFWKTKKAQLDDPKITMSNLSGGHVHARGSIPMPVEPRSHLAAPGVCTTMAASLPGAKIQENSNS